MKLFLAILLCVGAALSNSTHYYGWEPSKELVFRYESFVDSKIPEIKKSQKAGLRLMSLVRVQTKHDYSLRIQFEQPRFMTINGEMNEERREMQEEPIPEPFKSYLQKPFMAHMRRGLVESLFVESNEPVHVVNIKKALLSHLNMDLSASRRSEIESNRLEIPDEQNLESTLLDQSYFTVREQSIHGDCQTSYTLHPIPEYEAMEIEQQMELDEQKRNQKEHLPGGLSRGGALCRGRKYWQITKTRNFDNCKGRRPVFQLWNGIKSKCDTTKSSCKDLMNHVSSTTYIVCGNDVRDFKIRKSVTENLVKAPVGWKTEEEFLGKAKIILELVSEERSSSPIPEPSSKRELKSLVFEFPSEYHSHESLSLSKQEKDQMEQESGIRPVMPKPDLRSAPKMLFPVKLNKQEIIRQVEEQMQKMAKEMFESPESCPSKGDTAGHVNIIAKALRTMSFDELKEVESRMRSVISSQSNENLRKTLKHLFYETMALVGTNPAVMLVKERMRELSQSDKFLAYKMVQHTLTNIKTPTKELLRELVQMIKTDLKQWSHEEPTMFNVAMLQMSRLLHKACISPLRLNQYPVKVYGPFCSYDSQVIDEYINFLEQEFDQAQNLHVKVNVIAALGKMGHKKVARFLSKVISSSQYTPMVRSIAVYSLKKTAQLEPVFVKPILLTIIDNIAEATEVRIAAVQVLPWAKPSTAELQKIAVRTWFEPSKQVASFIFSTLKSLTTTEIPELKVLSQKTRPLLSLVKPFEFGYQYSKNLNEATWVKYLDQVISQEYSYVKTHSSPLPVRSSIIGKVYGGAYELNGPKWTVYTQGMDRLINFVLSVYTQSIQPSTEVVSELSSINQKLNIKERLSPEHKSVIFNQFGIFDYESELFMNEIKLREIIQKVTEVLTDQNAEEQRHYNFIMVNKPLDIEGYGPTDAGFPFYIERSLPMSSSFKTTFEMIKDENAILPRMLRAKIIPVVNVKMEIHFGVVSPFTQQLLATGVEAAIHLSTPVEIKATRKLAQITLDVKIPNEVQREIEVVHAIVKPYTVRKDLRKMQPISKSSDLKTILSGEPLKETNMNFGQSWELDAKLEAKTDAKYTDLYSYYEKIRQQTPVSLLHTFYLPSTLRMSSVRIMFNPQNSRTKEVSFTLSLVKNNRNMEMIRLPFNNNVELEDKELIKDVCKENFPRNRLEYANCVVELSAIDLVDQKVNSICQQTHFRKCNELERVCDEAKRICETRNGFQSGRCHEMSKMCFRKLWTVQHHEKTMKEEGGFRSGVSVTTIRLDADLKSGSGSIKGLYAAASMGIKKVITVSGKEEVRVISNVELKTPSNPIYEIKLVSKAEVPRVNNRWNTQRLVEEALQLLVRSELQFGFENSQKERINLQSTMVKSEQQKESVQQSPEYRRCQQTEQEGKRLTNVCEYTRHQAASIDEIRAEIEFPQFVTRSAWFSKVGDFFRYVFFGQMREGQSNHNSENIMHLKALVKRTGEEAQLTAEIAGREFHVKNIRIPRSLRTFLPLSLRNNVGYTFMQKMTRNQIPASCRIEPQYVSSFDNKTYSYELNDCWHLLFKDCSNKLPIAVLAKGQQEKELKVLAGQIKLFMKRQSSEVMLDMDLNGRKEQIQVSHNQIKEIRNNNGQVVMQVMRYVDNVYHINFVQEATIVLFDGQRVEISAPQMLKSRSCGLCGDLDHENTADLKTPEKCLMSRPRYSAYSYMIEESCQGIPSQDKSRYQEERSQCIKTRIIPTPVERISKVILPTRSNKVTESIKPMTRQHIVKYHPGKTCFSVERISVCSKISKHEVSEPKPVKVQRKLIQYVCVHSPSVEAQSLEQRARAGESLELMSSGKPVAYSKVEYEPIECQRQSNHL